MKKIKIDEQQDKQIRKSIKESLTESDINKNPSANVGQLQAAVGNNSNAEPTLSIEFGNNVPTAERLRLASKGAQTTNSDIHTELNMPGDPETDVTVGAKPKISATQESVIISKGQLDEIRLKKLKENSEMVKIENFLK